MAINVNTNQRVAIKIMNERLSEEEGPQSYGNDCLNQFLNEIHLSYRAKHRSIVQIVDFNVGGLLKGVDGRVERILYYVMKIEEYG